MPTITKPNLYFDVVTYTGTGATQTISGLNFQPDFVWIKSRSAATDNKLTDAVRGATKGLISNSTGAETTDSTGITAFTSSGFTLGSSSVYNNSGATYVAWCWKANGAGSTNTAGSITSTVSANTTSGFSVVTYTGNGNNSTVGHGLGIAPSMVIIKSRSAVQVWVVGHSAIGFGNYLLLNTTDASASGANVFNSTAPTSTVFSLGVGAGANTASATYVAYCFAPVSGYSAFGSWTGNGSADGPFVFTGFKPAYILWKRTDSSAGGDWGIVDATRNPSNVVGEYLAADTSGAGATYSMLDMVSNGFKIRWSDTSTNASGGTYIYMAFASAPFKFSLGR